MILFTVMETHKIHVNKQELKKTSEILGVIFVCFFFWKMYSIIFLLLLRIAG